MPDPKQAAKARLLMAHGVTPTIGGIYVGAAQKLEDKLTSVPILGAAVETANQRAFDDFNLGALKDAAYDKVRFRSNAR